jgi:hypothetical protein
LIPEYSEYSTVAGFVYIFMRDQPRDGKIFWSIVLFLLIFLGAYWTASIYRNWQAQPGKTFKQYF